MNNIENLYGIVAAITWLVTFIALLRSNNFALASCYSQNDYDFLDIISASTVAALAALVWPIMLVIVIPAGVAWLVMKVARNHQDKYQGEN